MLLGNYLNKYYKRYWYLLLIALIALIACDWFQLYLPDALGRIVSLFSNDASNRIDESSLMKIIYEVWVSALFCLLDELLGDYVFSMSLKRFKAKFVMKCILKRKGYL